ncbi:hypothetical protein HBI56_092040 [Parastagonospora nodorum]|uniref:Uncharacterized protein n=2 Tax=Phaeosphaeria nodorum (strain SN15 / ATCC MYA-4574 / FGSC 10173) TaxID=321614 RepID=A0A7U2F3D9_PHANO|nr:hypothetical protein SNOG_16554 [Parastagonospora nodorum SN15]KAH3914292.1 hypothetical protein HBH56_087130 [Parastagonospora nodorum]EAT76094.1 hypothetical protein SNOG_16554 [Parastagonospora nodorum SN15]KAH3921204.1 hypothetical protein HBH54_243950 [Parastagonospora nodorum]KAH3945723.1 hypothetical protein HBH53_139190 [Parastagonospora nodorum]KAH3956724.1 hypothetical protein HBH51_236120 [Parastagonospora nodorum]
MYSRRRRPGHEPPKLLEAAAAYETPWLPQPTMPYSHRLPVRQATPPASGYQVGRQALRSEVRSTLLDAPLGGDRRTEIVCCQEQGWRRTLRACSHGGGSGTQLCVVTRTIRAPAMSNSRRRRRRKESSRVLPSSLADPVLKQRGRATASPIWQAPSSATEPLPSIHPTGCINPHSTADSPSGAARFMHHALRTTHHAPPPFRSGRNTRLLVLANQPAAAASAAVVHAAPTCQNTLVRIRTNQNFPSHSCPVSARFTR